VVLISELKIRNFKSLESVNLKLGHFNLLVGANASGKSNFLDALRFLQGVGNGYTIDEVLDGKPESIRNSRWDGIRGGSKFVTFRNLDGTLADITKFNVLLKDEGDQENTPNSISYSFSFLTEDDKLIFDGEELFYGEEKLWEISSQDFKTLYSSRTNALGVFALADRAMKVAGHDFAEDIKHKDVEAVAKYNLKIVLYVARSFYDMQFLDPLPAELRKYSLKAWRLGETGEDFAGLIHEIESNGSKPALLEWLKELRPDEVSDLYTLPGAVNDYMAAIKEGNTVFPAPAISDGTLRFIALAAAFFQPSMPKVLVIEEIEKGLHPSRLRLLLELMRSQSKRTGTQVFATTHSPTLLAWLTEEDRKTAFVCTRDAESGATKMRSLAEVPKLEELIHKDYHLDQLFEEGWLESVLHES
jgi:predicted ATPase